MPKKQIIGMIHVGALPGTPASSKSIDAIVYQAVKEAKVYRSGGVHTIMIENMHDTPYLNGNVGPEITSAMTRIACEVKKAFGGPVGIQVLAAANNEAMAIAHTAGLDFLRAEGFVFAHVADEGIIESCAAELLRYRKAIGAEKVKVWADIKKKHSSHAITSDISLGETAHAAEFMLADAVIITGGVTGDPPTLEDVKEAKQSTKLPVILGSGVDVKNIDTFWPHADGFIIGSYFKRGGNWKNPPELKRVKAFMKQLK